jgi:hypothetical protein
VVTTNEHEKKGEAMSEQSEGGAVKFIPDGEGWGWGIAENKQLDIFRATCGDIMLVYHNGARTSHIRLSQEAARATLMGLLVVLEKHPINPNAPAAA